MLFIIKNIKQYLDKGLFSICKGEEPRVEFDTAFFALTYRKEQRVKFNNRPMYFNGYLVRFRLTLDWN